MKFWQKTFLATLALFLIAFDAGLFMLADMSYRNNMESEQQKCLGEHYFITAAIAKDMDAISSREGRYDGPEEISAAYRSLLETYGNYYNRQKVHLEVLKDGAVLYSNLPSYEGERPELSLRDGERNTVMRDISGMQFFYVAGYLPIAKGTAILVYAKDLSSVVSAQQALEEQLILTSIIISAGLAIALYLLLSSMSRPIRKLADMTSRFAQGNYDARVVIGGKDEFAELGQHFNDMAAEIETQMHDLEKAATQKQQFIDNLAHEIRTPLTTIYGYAEYIKGAAIEEEERLISAEYIMSESSRLKEVAFKLLDLALLKNTGIEKEEVDIDSLVEKTAMTIYPKTKERNIQLKTKIEPIRLYGDSALLESLLINFLDNAIKATDDGGAVMLRSFPEEDNPVNSVIEIMDNGRGMTPEQLEHVEQPFYRVDKARSREQGGAGLGISLCAQIARAHNAQLKIYSKPDTGTVVRITFLNDGTSAEDDDNQLGFQEEEE
ncbi:MAG: sensor histidine kinase [Christensenellaceae bacterium]|jgi:two-component system OmpR family sensor kinase